MMKLKLPLFLLFISVLQIITACSSSQTGNNNLPERAVETGNTTTLSAKSQDTPSTKRDLREIVLRTPQTLTVLQKQIPQKRVVK
jgi:hypothetical protein